MRSTDRRINRGRFQVFLIAVVALGLLGAMTSLAIGRGPLHTFLSRATHVDAKKGHVGGHTTVASGKTWPGGDKTPPETTISSGPSATTTATSAGFSFVSSEYGSTFSCKIDSGRWSRCKSPRAYTGLAVKPHQFSVRAKDAAGNVDPTPATWSWSVVTESKPPPVEEETPPVDTTPPDTTITGGPTGATTGTTASLTFTATEAGSSFECKLDGATWAGCTSPKGLSGLAVGSHTFWARAKDAAGNVDATPATRSWTVEAVPPPVEEETPPADTTPPDTTITGGPTGSITATTASLTFTATEAGSSFECKLDGATWAGCTSPKGLSGLAVGSHTFWARAKDAAGNVDATPATRSWTVEAVPPPVEEETPPAPGEECTTTVSSVSAAQSSVSSAAPGAVVCLADGSYGKVSLSATKAKPGVTLRAAHPGAATIAGASLQGSNLTLARFVSTSGISVQPGTSGMTVLHNRITGGGQGIEACPSTTTTCDDIKIIGNELIGPFGEDAIHLNRYHDADGDGVGVLIEGNSITGVRENGNHSDCLQTVWVGDHIVFRKNYLHDNRCQGFFIKDQASLGGVSGPIHGVNVEDNLFVRNKEPCGPPLTSCGQPMYFQVFGPYDGFKMKRNTIWGDGADSIAAFREGTGADTQISNNVIYRLWTDTNMSGVSLTENTVCQREGSWPSSRPGETMACSLSFVNPAKDDYRISGSNRGVDWAPAEVHFGP